MMNPMCALDCAIHCGIVSFQYQYENVLAERATTNSIDNIVEHNRPMRDTFAGTDSQRVFPIFVRTPPAINLI